MKAISCVGGSQPDTRLKTSNLLSISSQQTSLEEKRRRFWKNHTKVWKPPRPTCEHCIGFSDAWCLNCEFHTTQLKHDKCAGGGIFLDENKKAGIHFRNLLSSFTGMRKEKVKVGKVAHFQLSAKMYPGISKESSFVGILHSQIIFPVRT